MKKSLFLLSVFLIPSLALSQGCDTIKVKKEAKTWKGMLIDIGFNQYTTKDPSGLPDLHLWRSKNVNVYHYWGIPLGKKFTLAPGVGLGLENYSFRREEVLLQTSNNDSLIISSLNLPNFEGKKSKLAVNYVDIPLELRFQTGRFKDRAFRIAFGGKVGFLYGAHTKAKYVTNDHKIKEKHYDDFGLNGFRYGLTGRIGFGHFTVFGYYALSDLFRDNKGPQARTFSVGITLTNLFDLKDLPVRRKNNRKYLQASNQTWPLSCNY